MADEETTPDVVEPSEPAVESTEPAPAGWGGPSEEEWKTVVGGLSYLANEFQKAGEPEEEQPDFDSMDAGEIVEHYVNSRLSELEPYVQTAAKDAGERRMNELFDHFEKDPEIGKFDRGLASRVAEAVFGEVGDPVEAVRVAATMVSNMSKTERAAAVEEYKKSLQRSSFQDPSVRGAGERVPTPAKSYDEVIARWSGQEDV